jgi:uncharacterized membrane protein YedE/YeeE
VAALFSVGTAGASAFTGNTALMIVAVAAGMIAAYMTVHTVRMRRIKRTEKNRVPERVHA